MKYGFLILLCTCFASCTKKVFVPVESEKIEYRDRVLVDSIYQRDSVFIHMKGDTVWMERYQYVYRDKIIRDSVYLRDSTSYPVYVDVVKEVKHVPALYKYCFYILLVITLVGVGKFLKFIKLF